MFSFLLLKRIFRFTIRWIHVSEHTQTSLLLSTQQWPSSPGHSLNSLSTEMLCLLRSATSVWLLVTRNIRDGNGTPNCDFGLFLISSKLNIQVEAALLDSTAKVKWSKPHLCFGHSRNFPESMKHSINPEYGVLSQHWLTPLQLLGLCSSSRIFFASHQEAIVPSSRLWHNCSLHWETFFCSLSTRFFCSLSLDQGLLLPLVRLSVHLHFRSANLRLVLVTSQAPVGVLGDDGEEKTGQRTQLYGADRPLGIFWSESIFKIYYTSLVIRKYENRRTNPIIL